MKTTKKARQFTSHFYFAEYLSFKNGKAELKYNEDGTLFANYRKTNIYASELPKWYVHGRYSKIWGYMSTKGITDIKYIPSNLNDHFLTDDCLLICYGGKITHDESSHWTVFGYKADEYIWGPWLLDILKGAHIYSNYDISDILKQIQNKMDFLKEKRPEVYDLECGKFSLQEWQSKEFKNGLPEPFFAITLDDYFNVSFCSGIKKYYGTLKQIKAFIDVLPDEFKDTKAALNDFLNGNTEATHNVAYNQFKLLEPVKLITEKQKYYSGEEWVFKNIFGFDYCMRRSGALVQEIVVKDGDKFVRCIRPTMRALEYQSPETSQWFEANSFWGHPGILTHEYGDLTSRLYLAEHTYEKAEDAVNALRNTTPSFDAVCEDIFADG